jgi:ABC-type glycerol-3-phosphate transport system permease component
MPTPARSARTQARAGGTGPQATARRRRPGRIRRIGLPCLLLLPALLFELLVHLVPMVVGVLVSFKALTQLYLAQWEHAPWAGLGNYRIVADFNGAAGQALLHSFVVTCAFTAIAVSLSCLFGCAAAILAQDQFRGRGVLWTRWLVLGALTIFALVPVFVMVSSSLKPLQDVTGTFRWIPSPITFSSYIQMWQTVPLAQYFVNSLIVCTCAAALSVLVATFIAYAVSRYGFRGRRVFTLVVLSTQTFPGILFPRSRCS